MLNSLRAWILGVACLGLSGCITTHGSGPAAAGLGDLDVADPDAVDPDAVDAVEAAPAAPPSTALVATPPAAIQSLKEWDALPKEVRQDIIEDDYRRYKNVALTPRQHPEALADPAAIALAARISAYMRANGDMTVEDASHARVGTLNQWVQLLLLDGKTILGARVAFTQVGCDLPDESVKTFKTAAEAEGAGCDLRAGSWSAQGSFNHDGVPLEYGDYLEWSDGAAP